MISVGEVGVLFTVKDDATAVLQRLADQFNALQAPIDHLKESLSSIGASDGGLAGISAGFKTLDGSIDTTIGKIAPLKASLAETAAAARDMRIGVPGGGGGIRGGGGIEAEDIHFRNHGVALPGGNHASFGGDSFTPGAVLVGGAYATDKLLNAGGDLVTQQKLLRDRLGIRGSESNIDDATRAAVEYATGGPNGVIGTTPSENLKGITELLSVTPGLQDAIKMYPRMMRGAKDLEELTGGKVKADENMKTLAKALENLGGGIDPKTHELSPERMSTAVNEAVKTIIAGGGFIDASTLFGLSKQAGGMGRMTDPGHLFDETITSLIDQGGQRTGTGLSALGRQFLGDKMTKQTASELEELGILPHGSWRTGGGSGIIMNQCYDIKGIDDIKSGNLPDFMLNVLGPAIRAKVGDSNPDLMQESYKLFGQQTGQRLGLMFLQNEAQRERDIGLRQGVDPKSVYQGIGDKDYAANVNNLGTSFQGLMQVLGSNAIPGAITTLHGITAAIQEMTKGAADHPTAANNTLGAILTPSLLTNTAQAAKDLLDHLPIKFGGVRPENILMQHAGASLGSVFGSTPKIYDPLLSIHTPIAAPAVTLQPGGTVTGVAPINVTVNANVTAAIQTVMTQVKAEISGTSTGLMSGFRSGAGNASAGFDGRNAPSTPDGSTMHGGH